MKSTLIQTTFSLPHRSIFALENRCMSKNKLVILCLKRALLRFSLPEQICADATVQYNPEACGKKISVWLTEEEHKGLRIWRLLTTKSISYLATQAIDQYLNLVITMLIARSLRKPGWFEILTESLKHLHHRVKFEHKSLFAFSVVVVRPLSSA